MANTSIYSAFERMWQHVIAKLGDKASIDHTHDEYYTETEIDSKLSEVNASITNITNGDVVVAEAEHAISAESATSATSATKATQDASGNVITSTYETKSDASAKLAEAKSYADTAATTAATAVKNDLLNGAGTAYDTLKELGDLIDENTDAIDALETVASGKADASHTHAISDVTDLQATLDSKATQTDLDALETELAKKSFIITLSGNEENGYTADKTLSEVQEAYDSGYAIYCRFTLDEITYYTTTLLYANSPKTQWFFSTASNVNSAECFMMAMNGEWFAISVDVYTGVKNPNTLTINGTSYDGSEALDYTDTINDMIDAKTASYETKTDAQTKLDEAKSYADTAATTAANTIASSKADKTHTHAIADVTDLQTTLDAKADATHTHDSDYGITTSGTGAAYTATVDGITSLTVGVSFIMIPHTVSTSTAPTLNVNSLGAKNIRRMVSNSSTSTAVGYNTSWLGANKPIRVTYNGTYWIAEITKPSAADMSGTLGVKNGGTGKTSVTAGNFLVGNGTSAMTEKTPAEVLTALGVTATAAELNYTSGVTSNIQTQIDSLSSEKADASAIDGCITGLSANGVILTYLRGSGNSSSIDMTDGVNSLIDAKLAAITNAEEVAF